MAIQWVACVVLQCSIQSRCCIQVFIIEPSAKSLCSTPPEKNTKRGIKPITSMRECATIMCLFCNRMLLCNACFDQQNRNEYTLSQKNQCVFLHAGVLASVWTMRERGKVLKLCFYGTCIHFMWKEHNGQTVNSIYASNGDKTVPFVLQQQMDFCLLMAHLHSFPLRLSQTKGN